MLLTLWFSPDYTPTDKTVKATKISWFQGTQMEMMQLMTVCVACVREWCVHKCHDESIQKIGCMLMLSKKLQRIVYVYAINNLKHVDSAINSNKGDVI